jgi:hypothetical protein
MDYQGVLDEVTKQWGGPQATALGDRFGIADALAMVSMIAWRELASTPSAEEMTIVAAAAETVKTRSRKPRTVLRKLIEYSQRKYGWAPTPSVLTAAGMKVPA